MTIETGFDALMTFTCVKMGYCGCVKKEQAFDVTLLIPDRGVVTADQFAEWVFLADNTNPNTASRSKNRKAIRDAFIEHMGSAVVDASRLQYTRDSNYTSAITELVECQIEFCRTNPEIYIGNLIALDGGVFYPVDQIAGKDPRLFPQIEVCWFEHDAYWLTDDKEPIDYIKIAFHHRAESHISSGVFNRARLAG